MKRFLKVLACLVVTILSLIYINNIFAVGQVYQAIVKDDNGKDVMIYRTAIKPYESTVRNILKNYNYDQYVEYPSQEPETLWASYNSTNLIFTKSPLANYSPNGNIKYGYAKFNVPIDTTSVDSKDIKAWLANVSVSHISSSVEDKYIWKFADKEIMEYNDVNYDLNDQTKYNENLYHVGEAKTFSNFAYAREFFRIIQIDSSAQEDLPIIHANFTVSHTIPFEERGMMLCNENSPLYISDILIRPNYCQQLKQVASEKDGDSKIYVSAIAQTVDQFGTPFHMITPESFLHAKGANVNSSYNWSQKTLGRTDDKLYSGLNLWDNELVLPIKKEAEHKIIVKHLGVVGKNEQGQYQTEIIDVTEHQAVSLYVNDSSYWAASNASLRIDGGFESTPTTGEAYKFKGSNTNKYKVLSLNSINSLLDWKTSSGQTLKAGKYEYIGYKKFSGQQDISEGLLNILPDTLSTGAIEWQNADATVDNLTVVYLYYVSTSDIEVNHRVYPDKDSESYNVEGLKQSSYSTPKIIQPSSIMNYVEYYNNVDMSDTIRFDSKRTNELPSIPNVDEYNYTYIGYEINGSDDSYNITSNASFVDSTSALRDSTGKIKITFKYMLAKKDVPKEYGPGGSHTEDKIEVVTPPNPNQDIKGKLMVKNIEDIYTICSDVYSVPTNAKDNKDDIYAGITGIPTYILAGVNVEKLEHTGSFVDINLTISFGHENKNWSIKVPYYLSYYVVNNLLMYKYDNAEIYNTAKGYDTSGSILFNDTKRTIIPTKTSSLVLHGITNNNNGNNEVIENNKSSIEDWKNYLRTSYKTTYSVPSIIANDEEGHNFESSFKRDIITVDHLSNRISDLSYGEIAKYNTNDYITIENIRNAYAQIALDGSVNLKIQLASEEAYDEVSYSKSGSSISTNDLKKYHDNTDDKLKAFENAATAATSARKKYYGQCRDYGYGESDCKNDVYNDYQSYKSSCNDISYECGDWVEGSCTTDDEGNTSCEPDYYVQRTCWHNCGDSPSVCQTCSDYRSKYSVVSALLSEYTYAKSLESAAKTNLVNAYINEKAAVQNFDELYYIQENYWNVYKNYSDSEIIDLLGLSVKFDYQSTGARLTEDNGTISNELMTVQTHTTEKNVQDVKKLNNSQEVTKLEASRQTLSNVQKKYYTEGLTVSRIPDGKSSITDTYYNNNKFTIPIARLNGERVLAGKATYKIQTDKNIVGATSGIIQDNLYNGPEIVNKKTEVVNGVTTHITTISGKVFNVRTSAKFDVLYGKSKGNTEKFNIYTPLVVESDINQDIKIVNQDKENEYNGIDVVQANSQFTINFKTNYSEINSQVVKNKIKYTMENKKDSDFTSRYKNDAAFYVKFEFPVNNTKFIDSNGYMRNHGRYKENTWIGPIYGDTFTADPNINTVQSGTITDNAYNYYVLAVAVNISSTSNWTRDLLKYISTGLSDLNSSNSSHKKLISEITNICGNEGNEKISYYSSYKGEMVIVNRMYDFRVTDLKDVDWKNVFRGENSSSGGINSHNGMAYYAGISKWNTQDPARYNEIIGRTEGEIGKVPLRILPLGPYKNTDTTYTSAPKMGYRFSYDFKVTGEMNNSKSVTITPRFYYISKDGKTFNNEIQLYYKNNAGKYVKIGGAGDDYQIQITPRDGYRALINTDINNLSTKVVTLGSLAKITLNAKDVSTYSENSGAITYYGEYKLPNSTIAITKNGNVNSPLKNGYIGVIFDITANETNETRLNYGINSYNNEVNTSQWDWEGYLGITKPTKSYSTKMRLEKGDWQIDNIMYNKIKGTIILYDLDTKAANDFM